MGYRRLETENIPLKHNVTNPSDPYPVSIFNEEKPIADNQIHKYLDNDFFYYNRIYENILNFGLHCNWIDTPAWLLELYYLYKDIDREYEIYLTNKRY